MHEPGFNKTNYRAIRIRELVRMYGLARLPRMFLATRRMRPGGGVWMPGSWAETECAKADLPDEFWQATEGQRAAIERLGFAELRISKARPDLYLNPRVRGAEVIR